MPSDRVKAALEEFKAALIEEGIDEATIDAQTKFILPAEDAVVGNYADLQRMGAIAKTGTMPTPPGQEDVETDDIAEAFTGENPDTQDLNPDDSGDNVPTNDERTKADLQAELDEKGIEYNKSATKAELEALLEG